MIYVDTTHTGCQEGTRSKPLIEIPKFEDGESYHLSGVNDGQFNIDREVKIYGDMLFRADAGKAIRVEADNVEIHNVFAKGYGAHAIQAPPDCAKNLKLFGVKMSSDGYIGSNGLSFQGLFPLTVIGCTINKVTSGMQIQTDSPPDTLILSDNHISDTMPASIGGDGDGIFLGGITNSEIDFDGKAIIERNTILDTGDNAVDLVNAVNVMVRNNTMIGGGAAVIMGWQNVGGHHNVITKNFISGFNVAINSRGGYECEVFDNDIHNCKGGVWNDKMNHYWNNRFKNTPVEYDGNANCYINKNLVRMR